MVGAYSGLSSGGVTVVLDRLEKAGFIRRTANPDDRRSVLVDFAPAKQRKVTAHYDGIERQFGELLKSSPIEELETVLGFFAKMNAARPSDAQGG